MLDIAPRPIPETADRHGRPLFLGGLRRTAAVRMDLCAAPFGSGSFDVILCYHVLEHIKNDRAAIDEILRLLAPEGRAYIQVPQHRFRRHTVEFDAPDAYCHYHVRDPGLDYYRADRAAGTPRAHGRFWRGVSTALRRCPRDVERHGHNRDRLNRVV